MIARCSLAVSQTCACHPLCFLCAGAMIVCLQVADDPTYHPILNTLEIIPLPDVDPLSTWLKRYTATGGNDLVLSLKHRMNLGGPLVTDDLRRRWHAENDTNDAFYVQDSTKGIGHSTISTTKDIKVPATVKSTLVLLSSLQVHRQVNAHFPVKLTGSRFCVRRAFS